MSTAEEINQTMYVNYVTFSEFVVRVFDYLSNDI